MEITKSKYALYCKCPKRMWRELFSPLPPNINTSITEQGTKVGEVARDYFGKNSCVLANKNNPSTNPGVYAEYPLKFNNLKCFVDILVINDDGSIDIYEVKSVTKESDVKKDYMDDISFQYFVAYKLGLNIRSVNFLILNSDYIYMGGDYDLQSLFRKIDVTDKVIPLKDKVEQNINDILSLDKNKKPNCPLKGMCDECQYLLDCKKDKRLPDVNSVYDLYDCPSKYKYIEEEILSFKDLIMSPYFETLSMFNKRMVTLSLLGIKDRYVNKKELIKKLKKYRFPLYFFDFETVNSPLPVYVNSRPYQQIPFQYSLHIMNAEDDTDIKHEEFLGDGVNDPREELIKKMISDLGNKGTIVAYNMSFEQKIIKDLIRDFPQYANELEKIHDRFIDLKDFFDYSYRVAWDTRQINSKPYNIKSSIVYNLDMGASTSIKHVLPALFPNEPKLNYAYLGQVKKGDEASAAYLRLNTLSKEEREKLRKDMLDYCCLDTKAMLAIYFELKDLSD